MDSCHIHFQIPELDGKPTPRCGHTVTAIGSVLVCFGGQAPMDGNLMTAVAMNDVHTIDLDGDQGGLKWTVQSVCGTPPSPRFQHSGSAVANPNGRDYLYVVGGMDQHGRRFGDVHCLDLEYWEWSNIECVGQDLCPRAHHTCTVIAAADLTELVVYGGYAGSGKALNELEVLCPETHSWTTWSTRGPMPRPRFDHAATLAGTQFVISGGRDNSGPVDDLNILDVPTLCWAQVKQDQSPCRPIGLSGHTCFAVESALSWKLLLFGGKVSPGRWEDAVYSLDMGSMIWAKYDRQHSQVSAA